MIIDNIPVAINGEKNLLELIRKAGIELPTFCYYSELSVYGACRMCMVENKWGGMEAACSTPPRNGMEIYTNTPRLRKYRKMILELLLSNHCGECTTCDKTASANCRSLPQDLISTGYVLTIQSPSLVSMILLYLSPGTPTSVSSAVTA